MICIQLYHRLFFEHIFAKEVSLVVTTLIFFLCIIDGKCICYKLLQKELDAFASKFRSRFEVYYVLSQVSSFASTFLSNLFFSFSFCLIILKTMVKDIFWCMLNYRLFKKFKFLGNDEFNHLVIISTLSRLWPKLSRIEFRISCFDTMLDYQLFQKLNFQKMMNLIT